MVSLLLRLTLAMLCGGLLGLERGRKRRPAGSRTYMLVCLGAALTMVLSQYEYQMLATDWAAVAAEVGVRIDVARFGAQVVNGIGFLAAGTIMITGRQQVKGLTTAAGLWASACMGLAIGAGFYESVILCAGLIFLVMRYLPILENILVERARFINIYVEFHTLDDIGVILGHIKEQGAQICDVDIDRGHDAHSIHPSAALFIHMEEKQRHTQLLAAIAKLDCIYAIYEF